jgi:hypothetical protein
MNSILTIQLYGAYMLPTNCPTCGAALKPIPGKSQVVCSFCGLTLKADPSYRPPEALTEMAYAALNAGDLEEAYRIAVAATETTIDSIEAWLARGNCSVNTPDATYSYDNVRRLLRSSDIDSALVDIEWSSMVFNWGCKLDFDGKSIPINSMLRRTIMVPKGTHTLVFSCPKNRMSVSKTVDITEDRRIDLDVRTGFWSNDLVIE